MEAQSDTRHIFPQIDVTHFITNTNWLHCIKVTNDEETSYTSSIELAKFKNLNQHVQLDSFN